jgi:hypothetical protein
MVFCKGNIEGAIKGRVGGARNATPTTFNTVAMNLVKHSGLIN